MIPLLGRRYATATATATLRQRSFHHRMAAVGSTTGFHGHHEKHNQEKMMMMIRLFPWMFLAAATGTTMSSSIIETTATTTKCEEAKKHDDDDDDEEEDEEDDPYANLPEEDEPTHCSICMTYRQGPCRPYWRKVERCTKDNELSKEEKKEKEEETSSSSDESSSSDADSASNDNKSDDDDDEDAERPDPPCLKYMMPWIECATGFRNLYALIELDTNYTMGIADLEKDASQNLCWAPNVEPQVNWKPWQEYVTANKWKQPSKRSKTTQKTTTVAASSPEKVSLWKTLDTTQGDPEVVQVEASVPTMQGKGILECAYAVDQDGNVLGFSYGTRPSEAFSNDNNDDDVGDEKTKEQEGEPRVNITIRILPSRTTKVTIAGSYTQPPRENPEKMEGTVESFLYKSRPFSLSKMGKTKTKPQ